MTKRTTLQLSCISCALGQEVEMEDLREAWLAANECKHPRNYATSTCAMALRGRIRGEFFSNFSKSHEIRNKDKRCMRSGQ